MIRPILLLAFALTVAALAAPAQAELLPNGVLNDEQTSIAYYPETGEIALDAPTGRLIDALNIDSAADIFILEVDRNAGFWEPAYLCPTWTGPNGQVKGSVDDCDSNNLFDCNGFAGARLPSASLGNVTPPGLSYANLFRDLWVVGALTGGGDLGPVDLVYMHELFPGDANRDFSFDQLDLVEVLQAGKYLTGEPATWGEGDWNGGPGGYPGEPPPGDGLFDQKDIVAALQTGTYLSGAYAAITPGGVRGDDQTSIIYDANTGEVLVDAPAGQELTAINIDSADSIFEGPDLNKCDALACGGIFIICCYHDNIFMSRFGSSFGSLSFGNVAQAGLAEQFVVGDLTVVGPLDGGGDLGDVDLVYVPEPTSALLLALGLAIGLLRVGRIDR